MFTKADLKIAVLNFLRKITNSVTNFMAFDLGIAMIIIGITILVNVTNYGIFYQLHDLKEKSMGFSIVMIMIGTLLCLDDIEKRGNEVPEHVFWALLSMSLVILSGLLITVIVQNILLLTIPILLCVFWYLIYKNGKRTDAKHQVLHADMGNGYWKMFIDIFMKMSIMNEEIPNDDQTMTKPMIEEIPNGEENPNDKPLID